MANALLADGFVDLCFDTSLNFFDGKCRVLVTGQMNATDGTATVDTLTPVQSSGEIIAKFGASPLADALKKVFETCPNNIEVYAVPRRGTGTATVYTSTFAGTATAAGRISIYPGDADNAIDVFIPSGSTAAQVAALVQAALPADFAYTPAVVGNTVTYTAKFPGVIGNNLNLVYNWTERENYAPPGITHTFAETTAGTGELPTLDLSTLLTGCCYCSVIGLHDETVHQMDIQTYLDAAWSCDSPQCFGHGYVWNGGDLGTVLAKGNNALTLTRYAHCTGETSLPWNRIAAYGALSACGEVANPEKSIQGRTNGVLSAIREPQSCSTCWTFAEQTSLRTAQFAVMGQLNGGTGSYTNPYVFNDVTNNLTDDLGRQNVTFRSAASRRLAKATAESIAAQIQTFNGLGLYTKTTAIQRGVFGTNPRLALASIRAWAKGQVGRLFSEFDDIDTDIQLQTDLEKAVPCTGQPGKLHLTMKYIPPVRIDEVVTTLQPEILTNCDR